MRSEVINLNHESCEVIESMIKVGIYTNQDEVINAALKLLADMTNVKKEHLRSLIMEGENSSSPEEYDGEAHLAELKHRF